MNKQVSHIPSGYKPSPLGPIPEDWEVKRLGEIGEVLMCKRIMKYQTDSCGDIPFFKIGTFGGKPDAYISREVYDEYKTKYSYPKVCDVLISAAGTIGRSVIFDGTPSYYQDSNIVWIDNDNRQVLNKYLFYYYSTINWITDTGTIPRLYNGTLKAIQIPTPPIKQQTRIVSILELWDTAIAKQTALIEKLTLRKRGLMQQLLTGKKRLEGFSGEWKEVRLGEVAIIIGGGTPNTGISDYWNGNIPWFTPSEIGKNKYVNISEKTISEKGLNDSSAKLLPKGTILFTSRATIGAKAILKTEATTNQGFQSLVVTDGNNNEFIYYYLDIILNEIKQKASGSTFPEVSAESIRKIKVVIPNLEEQTAIASVLVDADKEIELANKKLARLQEEKRGLMQVLLTGKKRIK